MAYYLPKHNALFVAIPHTLAEPVLAALRRRLRLRPEPVGEPFADLSALASFRAEHQPYTFTFVRHPLDWYAASWQGDRSPDDPAEDEFAPYVSRMTATPGRLRALLGRYTGRGTADAVDFVGKTESLVADLAQVLDTLGVTYRPSRLAHLDQLQRSQRGLYTPDLKAMVLHAEQETLRDYEFAPVRVDRQAMAAARAARPASLEDVPGWFNPDDRSLFRLLLSWQTDTQPPGDLVELGVYLGKSAILLGDQLAPGETLTVCDLFGAPPPGTGHEGEKGRSFVTLERAEFERYYLAFHDNLPVVLAMPTSQVLDHVKPGTARFVHVDASHLYEHVAADVAASRTMLRDDGLVVFDDYRSVHTPGVALAVWEAMLTDGLKPIAVTKKKWFGTWGDPAPARQVVAEWVRSSPHHRLDRQFLAGQEVLRIAPQKAKPPAGQ